MATIKKTYISNYDKAVEGAELSYTAYTDDKISSSTDAKSRQNHFRNFLILAFSSFVEHLHNPIPRSSTFRHILR